ncbi:MAG: M20 family metallopeptidase [Fuerstiella sp.]|nr:M20 family metallopeptidase [Fuerstiella sp.]MCP4856377.1 M20 family metallopeptidase [Fuerstiella sp.]
MRSVDYLNQLIPFPSVSSTSNVAVSRWVEQTLQKLEFQTEWLEYEDAAGLTKACVLGRRGPDAGRGFAYFCHTDVVPVESWSFPDSGPWEPLQTSDRLYGRGSCDMKGSLACMLAAAESAQGEAATTPLYIVATADEEIGLIGARHIAASSETYRDIVQRQCRAIIGEPTLLQVVHAHKGGRAMKVTSHGVAAHSSTGKGINANIAMIPFLSDLRELSLQIEGQAAWQDDRFQPPTINMNIGINDHTGALNITPAQSVCTVYFRTMPSIDSPGLVDQIRSLAERHGLEFQMMFQGESLFTDPQSAYVAELLDVTKTDASQTVAYGTDGSCLTELKDIVVLGPGDIRQAHTDDEWVSLDQLQKGTDLYGSLIQRWCLQAT